MFGGVHTSAPRRNGNQWLFSEDAGGSRLVGGGETHFDLFSRGVDKMWRKNSQAEVKEREKRQREIDRKTNEAHRHVGPMCWPISN